MTLAASARPVDSVRRGLGLVLGLSLGLVALADVLFYRHVIGWTAGLFVASLIIAVMARPVGAASRRPRNMLAIATAGLALALVEEPTPLAVMLTMLMVVMLAMVARGGWTPHLGIWSRRWMHLALFGWASGLRDCVAALKWSSRHPSAARRGGPLVFVRFAGLWLLPVALGSVFVALFIWANPIFERWANGALTRAGNVLSGVPDLLDATRIVFWLLTFTAVWALLRFRTRLKHGTLPPRRAAGAMPPPPPADEAGPVAVAVTSHVVLPPSRRGAVVRCLLVFNAIFVLQTALDACYLYGGRHLPVGVTFKQYAHRGAYPLVVTALLAAAFVLFTFRKECEGRSWRAARALVYLWIAQNVMLTFSAGWRLHLLVDDSNLTRLRLATAFWLALVTAGLLSIIWRILTRRDNAWLLRRNASLAAIVLYACCFLNLDGFIADYNAARCLDVARNGNVLGLTYLRDLGIESIPALERLSRTLDTPERRAMAGDFARDLRSQLGAELNNWRGWTWRRARLQAR